jgi:hypothetical protein
VVWRLGCDGEKRKGWGTVRRWKENERENGKSDLKKVT